jgi:membrane protease YdiL (CAAX protease family)
VSEPAPRAGLVEPLVTFFVATALACGFFWLGQLNAFVQRNIVHGAIAVIFIYAPALAARRSGRPFDYRAAGLRLDPVPLNLKVTGLALAVTWPVFLAAFLAFYGYVCRRGAPAFVQYWAETFAPMCSRWRGLSGVQWRLPSGFLQDALNQIVVVAVPEELFFRGYLMGRFEERWPSRRTLFGAPVGWPLLVSSALFALGHFLVDFDATRLAVFFPGLAFAWMRSRTGSIAAGALFHALCNLLSEILHTSFFS